MSFWDDLADFATDTVKDPFSAITSLDPATAALYQAFRAGGSFGKRGESSGSGSGSDGGVHPSLIKFDPISEQDIAKTLMNPRAGVISDERLAQLMPNWQEDAMTAVNWNEQQFGRAMDMAFGRAAKDAQFIDSMHMQQADKMNKFLAEQFHANIDQAMPGFRDTTQRYRAGVDEMLSGELPASVKQQMERASAERGLSQGLFGQAGQQMGVRDLGLTAMDYIGKGQAQMGQLTGVMQSMQAPMIEASPTDVGALGSQYGASLLGMTTMSPTAAVAAGAQQAQIGIGLETYNQQMLRSNQELNVNRISDWLRFNSSQGMAAQQFNAQMNYASALSNLNYSLDQQAFEWNYKTAQMQAKASETASMFGAGGTALATAGMFAMMG